MALRSNFDMYEDHPVFVQPENEQVKVWRYMDFTKFVSLIDTRCLYFTRADKFDDPFEGSWPLTNVRAMKNAPDELSAEDKETYLKSYADIGKDSKLWLKFAAINCWHMNEHESAAMWKLYLKSNEGIAVQSTYNKLRSSISDNENVNLGLVKYIDYETEWIDGRVNLLAPFVHKRKSFEHEREVRALVIKWPAIEETVDSNHEPIGNGLKIKVDIEHLIEKIYIAPYSPDWFGDLVRALIHRYGYAFNVVQSKLSEQPIF
jgi:hypothetical protein